MKVEQRIGRIDRIGQRHEIISVLNLCYLDSAEQIVYDRLLKRLADAGAVVGTQQISLLPVTRDEFQELAEGVLSEQELEQRALERALIAKKRNASMEIPPQDLYNIYLRLSEQKSHGSLPVDMEGIWRVISNSNYLKDLGCRVLPERDKKMMILAGIKDVPDGTAITCSRSTYEIGVRDLEGDLHFVSYGDPVFAAILKQVKEYELPECIKRIEVQAPELSAQMIGYGVACFDGRGLASSQLVCSIQQLDSLRIDEQGTLADEDLQTMALTLQGFVREEFCAAIAVPQIEQINDSAGRSQLLLNLLVARDLVCAREKLEDGDQPFWRLAGNLEEICQDRDTIRARIPLEQARKLSDLLFGITLPRTGDKAYVDAPRTLLLSALEAACRLANGMKVKRAELTTSKFLERLDREIERLTRCQTSR